MGVLETGDLRMICGGSIGHIIHGFVDLAPPEDLVFGPKRAWTFST